MSLSMVGKFQHLAYQMTFLQPNVTVRGRLCALHRLTSYPFLLKCCVSKWTSGREKRGGVFLGNSPFTVQYVV